MKIETFIICDDIRYENGNKHSLMGVYDDSIIFINSEDKKNIWPKVKQIALFCRVITEKKFPASFELFSSVNDAKKSIMKGKLPPGNIKNTQNNKINLSIVLNNFEFNSSGNLEFIFKFFTEGGQVIEELVPNQKLKVIEK